MQRDIITGRFLKGNCYHDLTLPNARASNRACRICQEYLRKKRQLRQRILLKMEILLAYEVENLIK